MAEIYQLELKLIRANGVIAGDITFSGGSSDPYCFVKVGNIRAKSKVIQKTLNPTWDQTFTFIVPSIDEKIYIEVFDEDMVGKDDALGNLEIPLKSQLNKGYSEQTLPIKKPDGNGTHGTITLGINFTATPNQSIIIEKLSKDNQNLRAEIIKMTQRYKIANEQLSKIRELSEKIRELGEKGAKETGDVYERLSSTYSKANK
eukprot:TRINITY_DN1164_c0_g1_i1.p1 TRINITY_DN1164_c0_g1~~TRINITY_DN1164_c0_g1_i1.p1  ORF type:complete len:213 (-),score=54.04 TRINITY_DN1164_c0_g1_i1:36-641(-)